jgi:hypothetical protein
MSNVANAPESGNALRAGEETNQGRIRHDKGLHHRCARGLGADDSIGAHRNRSRIALRRRHDGLSTVSRPDETYSLGPLTKLDLVRKGQSRVVKGCNANNKRPLPALRLCHVRTPLRRSFMFGVARVSWHCCTPLSNANSHSRRMTLSRAVGTSVPPAMEPGRLRISMRPSERAVMVAASAATARDRGSPDRAR